MEIKLTVGEIYHDKHLKDVLYMGRIGIEFNGTTGIKGSHIFRVLNMKGPSLVWLTKEEISLLDEYKPVLASFSLNGDMANEFNDSFPSEEDYWDGDETDKIDY